MLKLPRFGFGVPRAVESPESPESTSQTPAPGSKTILMVEDEPAVRGLFAYALRREGYQVLEASNGAEALEVVARSGRLDLVITDVVMPVMRGTELARQLREQFPDLHFIFVSGYLVDEALGPNAWMLQKPFVRSQLLQLVLDIAGPSSPPEPEDA